MMNDRSKYLYALSLQVIVSLFGIFLMIFFIGEGIPNILHGRGDGLIPFLPALFFIFAGCIVVWFRKKIGAFLLVIGGAAMSVRSGDSFVTLVYGVPFIIPGLALWFLEKPRIRKPS
jgi:hypothetical protein